MAHCNNLSDLLKLAASGTDKRGITTYPLEVAEGQKTTYSDLLLKAEENAEILSQIPGFKQKSIVLLHFTDHLDNISWFWAVVFAGAIPAMSTPFSNIPSQRLKHIEHLNTLLDSPICLTRQGLLDQFSDQDALRPYAVEFLSSIKADATRIEQNLVSKAIYPEDLALLMLTSGSTGNAKAVCLTNSQILTAVAGKSSVRHIPQENSFLNWIGLDHVASLVEIHIQGVYLGVDQVHVQPADIISNPALFLNLISKHRVGRSFAPNFFLAKLRELLESNPILDEGLDLSCLRNLASGGEACVTETCEAVTRLLVHYGAPPNVIVAGFGMTETCAGAIFNLNCPQYDIQNENHFASLGSCMPGLEMRITIPGSENELPQVASSNQPGLLELRGPACFKGYFNNPSATSAAFSPDGWFKTGDQAIIDSAGNLNLIGRTSDTIIINGVKHLQNELESAIEESSIEGMTPHFTVCFPFRPKNFETEQIFIVYLPTFQPEDIEARIATRDAIIQVTLLQTGSRPSVLPLNSSLLQKSTLGKLSRAKIRAALERGDYQAYEDFDKAQILAYNSSKMSQPENDSERILQAEFCDHLGLTSGEFGVETPIFEMGVTSIHLIALKRKLQDLLSIPDIPILMMMANPTVRSLSKALEGLSKPKDYEPVVTLQQNGQKKPLWLFHPGVGEVLVFLGLAKFLPDRPVYALRARGFEVGETFFKNWQEAVTIYHAAIKAKQPNGPYLMAGYSYGTMLAFETAKVLEANGDQVAFLGSFNLPPHIKERMEQLDWIECLLHLTYFLSFISAEDAEALAPRLHEMSKVEALQYIAEVSDPARVEELSLSPAAFARWVDLAYGLQSMARGYEPTGNVASMDVFVATPLASVAKSKEDWVKNKMSKWVDFCRSEPAFHDVKGEHYTMIGETHVLSFQQTFRKALEARGL